MAKHVVWFPGSFDPFHSGHLELVELALDYDPSFEVHVMAMPGGKDKRSTITPIELRTAMLRMALSPPALYTEHRGRVFVLPYSEERALRYQQDPNCSAIVGSDVVKEPRWKPFRWIVSLRGRSADRGFAALDPGLRWHKLGCRAPPVYLQPELDLSSTVLRFAMSRAKSPDDFEMHLPPCDALAAFIHSSRLYKGGKNGLVCSKPDKCVYRFVPGADHLNSLPKADEAACVLGFLTLLYDEQALARELEGYKAAEAAGFRPLCIKHGTIWDEGLDGYREDDDEDGEGEDDEYHDGLHYLACLDGGPTLAIGMVNWVAALLNQRPIPERRDFGQEESPLTGLGARIGLLHSMGFVHGDLSCNNVLSGDLLSKNTTQRHLGRRLCLAANLPTRFPPVREPFGWALIDFQEFATVCHLDDEESTDLKAREISQLISHIALTVAQAHGDKGESVTCVISAAFERWLCVLVEEYGTHQSLPTECISKHRDRWAAKSLVQIETPEQRNLYNALIGTLVNGVEKSPD